MQESASENIKVSSQDEPKSFYYKIKKEFACIEITAPDINSKFSDDKTEFDKEASKYFFTPVSCQDNYTGNYDNYVRSTLLHIISLKELPYEKALLSPNLYKNYPSKQIKEALSSNKKLILLDLDETLIHSVYDINYKNNNLFDTIIRFKDSSSSSGEYYSIGIYVRNGVKKFLKILNNYFIIGIFTASEKDYADAIIKYLDPDKNIIKFCLYRNNCINVNGLINIKDLRIIKDIDLRKTILIDNSMYSFALQLSNGILINSFYEDKNDVELFCVLNYLIEYILPADDVRDVNEKVFGFKKICQQLE